MNSASEQAPIVNVNRLLDESRFSRIHWLICAICLCIVTFDGYDLVVYGTIVPILMKSWHLNPAQAGVLGSYALIGAGVGSLVLGPLADRIGRKKVIILCVTLFSVSMGLTGFATGPTMFGIFRFFAGVGIGGSFPNVIAILSEYTPIKKRAQMIATVMAGMQVGGIVAAAIALWLVPQFGWRSVLFLGALPILLLPPIISAIPETAGKFVASRRIAELKAVLKKFQPEAAFADNTVFEVNQGTSKSPVVALVQENRAFSTIVIWLMYLMSYYIIWGVSVWLPKLMMNAGFGFRSSLSFLITLNVGGWIGSVLGSMIGARVGLRKTTVVLFLLAFVTISLLGVSNNFLVASILVFLAAVGFMGAQNVAHGWVSAFYPPPMRSTAMGFCFTAGRLGGILGPPILGVLMMLQMFNFVGLAAPAVLAAVFIALAQGKYSYSPATK
jgi:AAHS family benzoate transporter-like MFS transporter